MTGKGYNTYTKKAELSVAGIITYGAGILFVGGIFGLNPVGVAVCAAAVTTTFLGVVIIDQ